MATKRMVKLPNTIAALCFSQTDAGFSGITPPPPVFLVNPDHFILFYTAGVRSPSDKITRLVIPIFSIQAAILYGFSEVMRLYCLTLLQVGNGARQFKNSVISPGTHVQMFKGHF